MNSRTSGQERIELHCHTKASGNATMYAGELLRSMDIRQMPAIAITDKSSVLAFPEIDNVLRYGNYSIKPIFGVEVLAQDDMYNNPVAISVLIKNDQGKAAIYEKLSTYANRKEHPVFKLKEIFADKDNLLLGSGAIDGALYSNLSMSDDSLRALVSRFDYIELLPYEEYQEFNQKLVALCDELDVPAVAISDAYYVDKTERKAWKILNYHNNRVIDSYKHHIFTTEEMLEAFAYLGKEKAYEIVVTNTHKIANQCGLIQALPSQKYYPSIDNATAILRDLCVSAIYQKYDEDTTTSIKQRLEFELEALDKTNMSSTVLMYKELMDKAKLRACDISYRGLAINSIVMYLLGLSEVDPIKYKLAPELVFGPNGDKEIDIDVNVPANRQSEVHSLVNKLDGVEQAVTAGAICYISENMALGIIEEYEEDTGEFIANDRDNICLKITGNYRGRSKHLGGQVIFPKGVDYMSMTPLAYAQDGTLTTCYEYHQMDSCFVKLDILANDIPEQLAKLSERTGIDLANVPIDDARVYDLFKEDEHGELPGCANWVSFGTDFNKALIKLFHPSSFDEVVKLVSIGHGTKAWTDNGEVLVKEQGKNLMDLITNRDDIFDYLLERGIERAVAYEITELVRKGIAKRRPKWNDLKQLMKDAGVPDWYIWSCEQVKYLFPRAHTISYVIMYMRLGWFKVYYPQEYAAVMSEYEDMDD